MDSEKKAQIVKIAVSLAAAGLISFALYKFFNRKSVVSVTKDPFKEIIDQRATYDEKVKQIREWLDAYIKS